MYLVSCVWYVSLVVSLHPGGLNKCFPAIPEDCCFFCVWFKPGFGVFITAFLLAFGSCSNQDHNKNIASGAVVFAEMVFLCVSHQPQTRALARTSSLLPSQVLKPAVTLDRWA